MAADTPTAQVAPDAAKPVIASQFDLRDRNVSDIADRRFVDDRRCDAASDAAPDEIVVCAPDQSRFRVKIDRRTTERFGKVEVEIGKGVTLAPKVEAVGLPGGVQSNRVMVHLKIGF